ncbi:DAN domain family member 5 [Austrofundulus limnaeus]|uniref:DAN domain family member 5 n=1 Tax=Austrofundulus limnaeus TaxID=52670 RepID=A0A2I4AXU3_AUSLI|nr:PREDICTED: DAN domain family member 5-like [Austrofundulus limnaeus]
MTFLSRFIFLLSCAAAAVVLPFDPLVKKSRIEFDSSGVGPDEPVQARVKVVQLDPRSLALSGFFRRGLTQRRALSHSTRLPFPAFLSRGRPAPAPALVAPASPLQSLRTRRPMAAELKKQQGLQMWQKVVDKGEKISLPVSLKDSKQTCTAVPFTQHVTADGCQTAALHNRLCFGQCSSLFVPSGGEFVETGAFHLRAPCSRCAPSRARTVPVLLRCGAQVREKRVMVVEACKCETNREERSAQAAAASHL